MGQLSITTGGSFNPRRSKLFTAQKSGHAVAVQDAIDFLTTEMLPSAVSQDLQLRRDGAVPDDSFAEAYRRGIFEPREDRNLEERK